MDSHFALPTHDGFQLKLDEKISRFISMHPVAKEIAFKFLGRWVGNKAKLGNLIYESGISTPLLLNATSDSKHTAHQSQDVTFS